MKKAIWTLTAFLMFLLLIFSTAGAQEKVNLAKGAPVKPSISVEAFGWFAEYVTDGMREFDEGTPIRGWSSAIRYFYPEIARENSTQWIKIDLGKVYTLAQFDLYPRPDGSNAENYFPIDYVIQVSTDDKAWEQEDASDEFWTTVCTVTDAPHPDAQVQVHAFEPVAARYVRIKATNLRDGGDGYVFQLAEIEDRWITDP